MIRVRLVLFIVLTVFAAEARAGSLRFQVGDASFTVGEDDLVCVRWKFIAAQPSVEIKLSEKASAKLAELTRKNVSKQMQIIKDGRVLQSAVILAPLTEGVIVVSGRFSVPEAQALARDLGEREGGCDPKPSPGSEILK